MFALYPLIGEYLQGTTASSLFEARLGREEMGGEVHIYAPAYREKEFLQILAVCDHIVFNSFAQWDKYKEQVRSSGRKPSCGIRVNPEYSEIETDLYNPCFAHSRLGITLKQFRAGDLEGIDGLHFHTMCEQNSDVLERTLQAVEEKFGAYIPRMKWVNFGGGHHITRPDYDLQTLIRCVQSFQERYGVQVYLEPGEAVALNAGYLVTKVLDIVHNGMDIAILDTSAACHMPDVLEMPYRPPLVGSGEAGEYAHPYRLAGPTCLAGDVIGDYSFPAPLRPGDTLVFSDMAIYTMVKNNTFNGIPLPAIALWSKKEGIRLVREFGYEDFKGRLS
jgi:carboxynorspermidine decarboxylase